MGVIGGTAPVCLVALSGRYRVALFLTHVRLRHRTVSVGNADDDQYSFVYDSNDRAHYAFVKVFVKWKRQRLQALIVLHFDDARLAARCHLR